jgi:hypothetical protein
MAVPVVVFRLRQRCSCTEECYLDLVRFTSRAKMAKLNLRTALVDGDAPRRQSIAAKSSGAVAAGLADFLAVVAGANLHRAAHFIEPRADAMPHAVGERVLDHYSLAAAGVS